MIAGWWTKLRPMLASTGTSLPAGPEWEFEVKWDGIRALARVTESGTQLRSRNGTDLGGRYPRLVERAGELGRAVGEIILDGECVAFDTAGLPSFPSAMRTGSQITFVAFDLLARGDRDLCGLPLRERRAELLGLGLAENTAGTWRAPGAFLDGGALFAATKEQGLEGVMAKRTDSRYRPGVRSADWLKFPHRALTDVIVVGYVAAESGQGASSLLIADPQGHFLGSAGSGITAAMARDLAARLDAVGRSEPPPSLAFDLVDPRTLAKRYPGRIRWAEPVLAAEVRHLGYTEGRILRQPILERVRDDLPGPLLGADSPGALDSPPAAPTPASHPVPGSVFGSEPLSAQIAGRTIRLTHLDKVLYPATGTTKAHVIQYMTDVAGPLLRQLAGRPITRRRWPHGVAEDEFFEKAVPRGAPSWLGRVGLRRNVGSASADKPGRADEYAGYIDYPLLAGTPDEVAALVWFAQTGVLELHTPQWRVRRRAQFGVPGPVDRMVLDLDPGPPAGLPECCEVAVIAREILTGAGFNPVPVASGSKGLHVYVAFPDPLPAQAVLELAEVVADGLAAAAGDLVIRKVSKALRAGRVYVDVAQNAPARTTITPYSPRGREHPNVATPLLWSEVDSRTVTPATVHTMADRLAELGDLMP